MTNNHDNHDNDDFIEPEIGAVEEPTSGGMKGNIAEAWRTQPLFKFMVLIIAVVAVGVAGMSFFGGSAPSEELAHLAKPPSLHEAPGGAASPYVKQQTDMANENRAKDAIANGGSALPTPIGQTNELDVAAPKDNQLNELHAEIESLKRQQTQQQQVQQQQVQQRPPEQFDNTMAEAMQRQMQQLMDGWAPKGMKDVTVVKVEDTKTADDKAAAQAASASAAADNAAAAPAKTVVSAGTVSYAQLLTEANSDVPGPILAQIVSGPLAGARAVGSFKVTDNYEKYLVLKFNIADKKGKDYTIDAIALDPDTTLGGMATEVDERYLTRVLLPAAAGFLQGMGQALGQGNSSITTTGTLTIANQAGNGYKQGLYTGMGDAAQTMGQFFQNQANQTKPLVRVAAGTPMGLFFVSPVKEPTAGDNLDQNNKPANANGYGGYGYGANGNGYGNPAYPGATIAGYGATSAAALAAQNAAANGAPYPNYAMPNGGYNYGNAPRGIGGGFGGVSPYSGYGQ